MIRASFGEGELSALLCLTLLHSLWQVGLLALAADVCGRIGRRSVERQYAWHVAALVAGLVAMPVTLASLAAGRPSAVGQPVLNRPAETTAKPAQSGRPERIADVGPVSAPLPSVANAKPEPASIPEGPPPDAVSSWVRLSRGVATLYGFGVALMLARLALGVWKANRLGRGGTILCEGPVVESMRAIAAQCSLRAAPLLVRVEEIAIPKVVGLVWPRILLPASALAGLSPSQLELVLIHELAHVRRHDMWVNLLERLAEAVLFFNPVVWYLTRRISTLREFCCDEMTCRVMTLVRAHSRTEYALSLLRVVELARTSLERPARMSAIERDELIALSASGRSPSQLRRRLASLLGEPAHEPLRLSVGGLLTVVALALFVLFGPVSWRSAANSRASDSQQPAENPVVGESGKSVAESDKPKPAGATAETSVTAPITVSGRAIDAGGKPIAGAKIYLASQLADWKRIGETTTDASGRYFFRNAPLPIQRADTNSGRDFGAFLVYGEADGHGFAWRPTKWYYPQPNRDISPQIADEDYPRSFQQGEKIELDLRFAPSTTVRGRVVDSGGKPIANTELSIWDCERIPADNYRATSFNLMSNDGFELLNAHVPRKMQIRRTDATGRFEFTGLPAACRFRVHVKPPGFPTRMIWFSTQAGLPKEYDGKLLYDGLKGFEVRFPAPRVVPIQVRYGDTGKPAVDAWVELFAKEADTYKTTDAAGRVQLGVPGGEYKLHLLPAYKTPYLETDSTFKVDADSPMTERIVKLRPAARVEIKVRDQQTGKGVAGVDLWHVNKYGNREEYYVTSWVVATWTVHRDRQRTDKNGVIHEFFEPGKHHIGVGLETYPQGYEPIEPDGKEIDCQAGKPLTVEFQMRKVR
jgi:protocatechuate 3,4-dioxygenase beta subunit